MFGKASLRKQQMRLAADRAGSYLLTTLHTGEFHNYWAWDHMHNAAMGRPLLVLDIYEHAYHVDYGAAATKYVDAFMQTLNWEEVNRRVEAIART